MGMRRICFAGFAALVFVASAGTAGATTPSVAEFCPPIEKLAFHDVGLGTRVDYDAAKKTVTFTTADGRKLVGKDARKIGKRKITITSRSPTLTIVVSSDVMRGQARASATERDVDENAPTTQGAGRQFHQLFVGGGKAQAEPCRAVPRPTATPKPTKK